MLSASPFKDHPLKSGPELQIGVMQPAREGSPPPGLRLPQAQLSRNSNQIARGRIRQFESYMPSQPVRVERLLSDRAVLPPAPPLPARTNYPRQLRCTRQVSPAVRSREQSVSAAWRLSASTRMRVQVGVALIVSMVQMIVGW
jgi:hypothetical protein